MTYTHFSQTERYQIQALMKAGQTQIEIARILGHHKSTISRELARGSGRRGYRPAKPRIGLRSGRNTVVMPLAFRQKSGALLKHFFVCSGALSKSPVSCQLAKLPAVTDL
jgi:IS30 family transposase